ncbi:hypothetical protein [Bradyrhizobium elkanii]
MEGLPSSSKHYHPLRLGFLGEAVETRPCAVTGEDEESCGAFLKLDDEHFFACPAGLTIAEFEGITRDDVVDIAARDLRFVGDDDALVSDAELNEAVDAVIAFAHEHSAKSYDEVFGLATDGIHTLSDLVKRACGRDSSLTPAAILAAFERHTNFRKHQVERAIEVAQKARSQL